MLNKISAAGLTINPEKCEFCRSQVRYLGFIVQRDGLKVDPGKVQPILDYPVPRNIKQLRRLLGMASWYRRFVPQFATISEPLTRLLKKTSGGNGAKIRATRSSKFGRISLPRLRCRARTLAFRSSYRDRREFRGYKCRTNAKY